jgi:hypothetical protein
VQKVLDIGGLENGFGGATIGGEEHRFADFFGGLHVLQGNFAKAELCFGTTE